MFDKSDWAYNDISTVFQFCKWAQSQTDWHVIYEQAAKTAGDNIFIKNALIGYMKKKETLE